jgi:glutamyl-tRNA synthetase
VSFIGGIGGPRVRFAPSPTGYLHVGGARTALFNWLFARRNHGAFILRIEDTDAQRSSEEMVSGILDGLKWLGLDWDEGPGIEGPHAPYFQSQRFERHRALADRLIASGHAYRCYCAPELLKQKREAAERQGLGWKYDRTCLRLTSEEIRDLSASGTPHAVRIKVPDRRIAFTDRVHGAIEFDADQIEDFVILRSDRQPTYHLSVVADDVEMGITHVVRGDDHISNTPKQLLLYDALGFPAPEFAHVPLILGPDKKRLSKRHGATSVTEYQRAGYIPEAMVNFLVLLGWSPGRGAGAPGVSRRGTGAPGLNKDQELFSRAELVDAFSLDGISGGNAVFNPEKLDWFNAQHLARLPPDELSSRVEPGLREAGLWNDEYSGARRTWLQNVLGLLLPRVKRLPDFVEQGRPFFEDAFEYDPEAVKKHLSSADLREHVAALRDALKAVDPFEAAAIESVLRSVAQVRGIKAGSLIHATRVAVTGRAVSPGLFEVLALLGRDRTLARLERLERFLETAL